MLCMQGGDGEVQRGAWLDPALLGLSTTGGDSDSHSQLCQE